MQTGHWSGGSEKVFCRGAINESRAKKNNKQQQQITKCAISVNVPKMVSEIFFGGVYWQLRLGDSGGGCLGGCRIQADDDGLRCVDIKIFESPPEQMIDQSNNWMNINTQHNSAQTNSEGLILWKIQHVEQ